VGLGEYELFLSDDSNTKGHTQWFYFAVEGMVAQKSYTFSIVNLRKADSLYHHRNYIVIT